MKKRVAILISGGGSNMMALVRSMQSGNHPAEPVLVIANLPGAGGLELARAAGVPTLAIDHRRFAGRDDFEAELQLALLAAQPDIVCLAGFMRVLSAGFVGQWQGRMLNIHPSLLPLYPGLHTHERALSAGDGHHGASVHLVTSELDSGPILGQVHIRVIPGETAEMLARRLLPQEHRLYALVLRRFAEGNLTRFDLDAA